ncbi:MAG: prepilin-type N-terminal cleavage/methylation domain-containing protein, partial [Sedimentisphaerales bacterium]|nr:prepilin-type N-terminal cleavage/methylation domain-containing protein [Sedimentisphaerales bacterium]
MRCSHEKNMFRLPRIMKKGFSVAELIIVVAILGIMAAVVVPQFQSQSTRAKNAVAKDNLRLLRG